MSGQMDTKLLVNKDERSRLYISDGKEEVLYEESLASKFMNLPVPYRIKVLNKYDETCVFCNKKTRIDSVESESAETNESSDLLCKGCTPKGDKSASLQFDIRRVTFTLDWCDPGAVRTDSHKIYPSDSYKTQSKLKQQMKNTLNQCFRLYSKTEKVELNCEKCQHKEAIIMPLVQKPPNILIVHFKRFKFVNSYLEKMDNHIEIPKSISIQDILVNKQIPAKYELYAVTCHRGSGFAGHYFTYILKNKKNWVLCDDESTQIVNFSSIDESQVYLLFYKNTSMEESLVAL